MIKLCFGDFKVQPGISRTINTSHVMGHVLSPLILNVAAVELGTI